MPIYEYQCHGCGQVFEVFQKASDPAPAEHECGSKDIQRILSNSAFVLKGSGWYITDYARKEHKEGGKAAPKAKEPKEAASSTAAAPTSEAKGSGTTGGGEKT